MQRRSFSLAALLCILITFAAPLYAQQFVFNAYRQDQGLNNISISAMAFDHEGFLWIGTGNGVYRFLGSSSVGITLTQGISEFRITDIHIDPNGTVWVGTNKNLYRWNGSIFVPAGRTPIAIWNSKHIASLDATHLLVLDKNLLYILEHDRSGNMISYRQAFSDGQLQASPFLRQIHSIAAASDGTYWMGCGNQICSWRAGKLTIWDSSLGVPQEDWKNFLITPDGSVWAASSHRRIELSPWETKFAERPLPNIDPDDVYSQAPFIQDRQGSILTSTRDGLARWDGSSWHSIGPANGLHVSYITDMAFDGNGDLWIGTTGHGLIRWAGYGNYDAWTDSQGLPSSSVWTVVPSDDQIFTGTEKGPAAIDSHTGSVSNLISGSQWNYGQVSTLIRDRNGVLWGGTFSGAVVRINPKTHQVTRIAKLPSLILNFNQEADNRIWISTRGGVYLLDPSEEDPTPQPVAEANKLLKEDATVVYKSCSTKDGSTWFLTSNSVLRFQNGSWSSPAVNDAGFLHISSQLEAMSCAADGSLWVTGPQAGIWYLVPNGNKMTAKEIDLPEEFRKFATWSILADHRGWIWIGMDSGLLAWNGSLWSHLTRRNGLIWDDINRGSFREAADGSIWVGTSSGVVHLPHPEHVFDPVLLTVTIYNIQRGNRTISSASPFTLPWDRQSLRFQFAAPGTVSRSDLHFSYRIPSLDSSWIATQDGEAIFPALPYGSYTFQVSAHDADSATNSPVTSITFRILPPWWRSTWFYLVCVLTAGILGWLIHRLRTYQLHKHQRLLEETVRRRTRELEASHQALHIQATHDALTGLANRAAILERLDEEIARSRRDCFPLILVVADIDHFKRINDTYGHLVGDAVLRHFAKCILGCIRSSDYAGRYGGEEFLVILPNIALDSAIKRLTSLHECMSNLLFVGQHDEFTVTCSFGSTILLPSDMNAEANQLLARADRALYQAKQAGRNRFVMDSFSTGVFVSQPEDSS